MRKLRVMLVAVLVCAWMLPAYAIVPMTEQNVRDAQEYGKKKSMTHINEFLAPWTTYEEKATIINDATEKAYIYTPYLLVAHQAREYTVAKKVPTAADAAAATKDYEGYYCFAINIVGYDPNFVSSIVVSAEQENQPVPVESINATKAEKMSVPVGAGPQYTSHVYAYCKDSDVKAGKLLRLTVFCKDEKYRSFNFDIAKIK